MNFLRYRPRLGSLLAPLLFAGLLLPVICDAAAKRIPTHEDIWLMKRVGAPQVSPDGRWIVVPVAEPSYDENTQLSDLWLIDTTARNSSRRLTSTRRPESGVVWSPDSRRIVFSAQRDNDEVPQLYSLDLAAGGEAQRLTNLSGGARAPVFSHDGRQLAFVSIMYPGAQDDADNKARIEAYRNRKSNARIYEGFPVRNWDHWLDERQVRIFVQTLDEDGLPLGRTRDLLAGTRLAANPGFAGRQTDTGEEMDIEFTPDNQAMVFPATTNRNQAAYSFTDAQLFVVSITGGEPRAITSGLASWSMPHFTRDGGTLLAVREQQGPKVYNPARLAAFSWPNPGEPRIITDGIDRPVSSYAVSPDSRTVYFTAEDAGSEKLFSVRLGGGTVQTLFGVDKGSYTNVVIPERADNLVLYGNWESASAPAEVALINPSNGKALVMTRFNAARVAQLDLPPIENFWFTSSRGKRIHSFLVRPPGFDASKKYPLFVVIHGGPHGMWRDQFFVRWNYHLLAAPGYVLLLTNYSGSTGFGEEFARSIQGDPLQRTGRRDQRGRGRRDPRVPLHRRPAAVRRRRQLRRPSRQLAAGHHHALQVPGQPRRPGESRGAVGHQRYYLLARGQHGWPAVGAGGGVARTEPDPLRGEIPHPDAGDGRRERFPRAAQQYARVLERAAAHAGAEPAHRLPRRESLDPEGRGQPLFYSEVAAWLARWLKPAN